MEPYTKSQLQQLKDIYAKQLFKELCEEAIESIYTSVVQAAKLGQMTYTTDIIKYQLKETALNIVIEKLKSLFPDANIMYIDRKMPAMNIANADLVKMGVISINWM